MTYSEIKIQFNTVFSLDEVITFEVNDAVNSILVTETFKNTRTKANETALTSFFANGLTDQENATTTLYGGIRVDQS